MNLSFMSCVLGILLTAQCCGAVAYASSPYQCTCADLNGAAAGGVTWVGGNMPPTDEEKAHEKMQPRERLSHGL